MVVPRKGGENRRHSNDDAEALLFLASAFKVLPPLDPLLDIRLKPAQLTTASRPVSTSVQLLRRAIDDDPHIILLALAAQPFESDVTEEGQDVRGLPEPGVVH